MNKKTLERIKKSLNFAKKDGDLNEKPSWEYQQGILLSYEEAQELVDYFSRK